MQVEIPGKATTEHLASHLALVTCAALAEDKVQLPWVRRMQGCRLPNWDFVCLIWFVLFKIYPELKCFFFQCYKQPLLYPWMCVCMWVWICLLGRAELQEKRERNRETETGRDWEIISLLVQSPNSLNNEVCVMVKPGATSFPGSPTWVAELQGVGPRCFSRWINRELNQKWSRLDSNLCLYKC